MNKGKIIVIEGTDGSGKATQTKLLVDRLKKERVPVKTMDFPRYRETFFGQMIGEALHGVYGDFLNVHPKIVSVLYAADRWKVKDKINQWLLDGFVVILDRYVGANQIHQGAKIGDMKLRQEFLKWLDRLEYKEFGIPRPNLTIFLDVDPLKARQLINQEKEKKIGGKRGLPEEDISHQILTRATAQELAEVSRGWKRINCMDDEGILTKAEIADEVYAVVKKYLKL